MPKKTVAIFGRQWTSISSAHLSSPIALHTDQTRGDQFDDAPNDTESGNSGSTRRGIAIWNQHAARQNVSQ
jgi:hypothetical protein